MNSTRNAALAVNRLEDRTVPAQFGTPWSDGTSLTVSFVPDGADVNGSANTLFQTFQNAGISTQSWQQEIVRAFTAWTNLTNLNVGIVRDSVQPFGTLGAGQGDNRFGDVRIYARPLSDDVLAVTTPPGYLGGTRVGDIILNSAKSFSIGGGGATYDLYSVMLQECGHALGVGNSPNTASPMYEQYLGVRAGLIAEDIAAIKSLYGSTRAPDAMESPAATSTSGTSSGSVSSGSGSSGSGSSGSGSSGSGSLGSGGSTTTTNNNTSAAAYEIKYANSSDEATMRSLVVRADLTTATDIDYYKFRTPSINNGQGVTIQISTAGLSMLAPRLLVYNRYQSLVGMVQTANVLDGQLTLVMPAGSFALNTDYYVRVDSALSGNQFKIGSYQLRLIFDANADELSAVPVQLAITDNHTNDVLAGASVLASTPGFAASTHYRALASLHDATDVDFYAFTSPLLGADQSQTLTVTARALNPNNGMVPQIQVFDSLGVPVADASILVNGEGTFTIQVLNAASEAVYFIGVAGSVTAGITNTGKYQLDIDFRSQVIKLEQFADGSLTDSDRVGYRTLESGRSQVMHFVLSATGGPAGQSGVLLTIHDKAGAIVHSIFAKTGTSISSVKAIDPGTYILRFYGLTSTSGATLPNLTYSLRGMTIDDPIGPDPADPEGESGWRDDGDEYYEGQDLEEPPADPPW